MVVFVSTFTGGAIPQETAQMEGKKGENRHGGQQKIPAEPFLTLGDVRKIGRWRIVGRIIRRQMLYPLSYGCLVRAWNDIGFYAMLYYTPDSSLSPDPLLPTGYLFLSLTLRCIL